MLFEIYIYWTGLKRKHSFENSLDFSNKPIKRFYSFLSLYKALWLSLFNSCFSPCFAEATTHVCSPGPCSTCFPGLLTHPWASHPPKSTFTLRPNCPPRGPPSLAEARALRLLARPPRLRRPPSLEQASVTGCLHCSPAHTAFTKHALFPIIIIMPPITWMIRR